MKENNTGNTKIKKQLDIFSMLLGLCGLVSLLYGVIPSIYFQGTDETIGLYDIIQYIPDPSSFLCVVCLSFTLILVIFSFIKQVPRPINLILSVFIVLCSFFCVLTLNGDIPYLEKTYLAENITVGLKHNYVIILYFIYNLGCLLLSLLSVWYATNPKFFKSFSNNENEIEDVQMFLNMPDAAVQKEENTIKTKIKKE